MILMIDNYDSFTYNLVQELSEVGSAPIEVVRNDAASAEELLEQRPQAVVISPGPGLPEESGVTLDVIRAAADLPLLGICLGHQAIAVACGARVVRASEPVHGKTSPIFHAGAGIFEGLADGFEATRYHSLIVERETWPERLEITAWTEDGVVMGLRDRDNLHFGVQFHPESYLCVDGRKILARFLDIADIQLREEWKRKQDEE
ncbi:MAG: aminodeoxychorismate/anthranilate synthase component II [Acidobacteria bacterium]|nr:aminodeoxychorismate/anthranilate synthase component II [Acidobacteriota bacterium]